METELTPLLQVARLYILESCPDTELAAQDKGLKIIEDLVVNNKSFDEARREFRLFLNNTLPIDKIMSILSVGDDPLPPQDEMSKINTSSNPTNESNTKSKRSSTHETTSSNDHSNSNQLINQNQNSNYYDQNQIRQLSAHKRRKINPWNQVEDFRLLAGIHKYGLDNWLAVSKFVGNSRTRAQCSQRWNRGLDPNLKKCRWTYEEERQLLELIKVYGVKAWTQISQKLGNRSDVQCRYHYNQMLKQGTLNGNEVSAQLNSMSTTVNSIPHSISHSSLPEKTKRQNNLVVPQTSPLPLLPTPHESPKSTLEESIKLSQKPEKSLTSSKEETFDNFNFDNIWDMSYSTDSINEDLFVALEQKSSFFSSESILTMPESLI
ncbi:Myb-like DNA-binding domain containing protein [Tritrichomonas foetus]|uniref:Myb-like DNA-binding domain containing protein n=1 Tax=Tritrichomonas foetus TaxID=1144522 RepID=A0A1J4K1R1_9EUKA|nr:Myb-like DNA-binding domain containing protein [Tritrichomonas foetus]|eukprot:OHT04890.1 Myb-like DNA-binding domain containing protein [Tritrichomonas foetus]